MTMTLKMSVASLPAVREVLGRKPYQRPSLVHYGDVRALTTNTGGSNAETSKPGGPGNGCFAAAKKFACPSSDRRLKQNEVRIGNHPLGFGLYLFDYKPQYQKELGLDRSRQFGVMADEVESVMPHAVVVGSHGFKTVDYDMLGIQRTVH